MAFDCHMKPQSISSARTSQHILQSGVRQQKNHTIFSKLLAAHAFIFTADELLIECVGLLRVKNLLCNLRVLRDELDTLGDVVDQGVLGNLDHLLLSVRNVANGVNLVDTMGTQGDL